MKAVVASGYGAPDVLSVQEVEKPFPKDDEILIKVHAASLNSGDVRVRSLDVGDGLKGFVAKIVVRMLVGYKKPKRVPGSVLAGEVVEVGKDVDRFKVGDEVYAMAGFSFGGFGEYCTLPTKRAIALKPKKASFEEASTLPFGGNTAMYFLRKAGATKGKKVLVYGSTGAVGSSAVQVAKYFGCEVTAVSGKDGMQLTRSLGATKVYDYRETSIKDITGKFDIVFDAVGKISKSEAAHLVAQNGKYATVDGLDAAKELSSDLEQLAEMYDKNQLVAVIDKTFDLTDIIEANHYVDAGRKKGSVVIRVKRNSK
jgi:NADPH:quinone reductase-like Zn-dependent oxidoreductase